MTSSNLLTLLALLCAACAGRPDSPQQARGEAPTARPNILFILSDDHAAQALGCYGSAVAHTPSLDALAAAGLDPAAIAAVIASGAVFAPPTTSTSGSK